MKFFCLLAINLVSVSAMSASNQWSFVENENHFYWQEKGCYSYVDLNSQNGEKASFEIYTSKDQEFARPMVQIVTEGMPEFYEATSYFNNLPNQSSYSLVRMQKENTQGLQVLTLPMDDKGTLAEYLEKLIKKNSVYVELKNKDGQVKKVRFVLRKSSLNIRKMLNKCFVNLSKDIGEV